MREGREEKGLLVVSVFPQELVSTGKGMYKQAVGNLRGHQTDFAPAFMVGHCRREHKISGAVMRVVDGTCLLRVAEFRDGSV